MVRWSTGSVAESDVAKVRIIIETAKLFSKNLFQTEISTANLDAIDVYLGEMVFVTTFIY